MVNLILFRKSKIVFQVLLIVLYEWSAIDGQLNLHDTDQRFQSNALQFDCLNYRIRHEKLAYQLSSDVVDEVIPYCIRPATNHQESSKDFDDSFSQELRFEELRMADVTVQQLLSWSISMEVVERYQFYLNKPDPTSNEYLYNCTSPRFGLRCQYMFEVHKQFSFNEIVEGDFLGRSSYPESSDLIVAIPCYVLLKCYRNGQPWCLDWREVCNGIIDCVDEGIDEQSCFDMEINECRDDEYRCHNGLCISQEFWEDGLGTTECLDRSDTVKDLLYLNFCFQDPTFRCEEHSCHPRFNSFSCGDGQCCFTQKYCRNGRHVLSIDSMTAKGNLTDYCRNAMACLTGLVKKVNETRCDRWLMHANTVETALQQCGSVFQFPTNPIHSDHIRFVYEHPSLRANIDEFLTPDYVCYNEKLCEFLIQDFVYENQTCLNVTRLMVKRKRTVTYWDELVAFIANYFQFCLISPTHIRMKTKYNDYPSLYNCQNSLKLISKHRLMDNVMDCFHEDDEDYPDSCQLDDQYRVTCIDPDKCWSPIVKDSACELNDLTEPTEISFQKFCNGVGETYDNDEEYDDESGCGNWSCNNMYARCDGFWACSDGRDEENCTATKCSAQTYACISPVNYTVICLQSHLVNDGHPHCLGALDEQAKCRFSFSSKISTFPFRCSDQSKCIQASRLCDTKPDCGERDDENEIVCNNQQLTCAHDSPHSLSEAEEIVCGLREIDERRIKYFSVYTSFNYPSLENQLVEDFNHWTSEPYLTSSAHPSQVQNNTWPWYCHRGLVVSIPMRNSTVRYRTCICPPSYYGRFCQYQNQRVSLTLRLASNDRQAIYAVVSMLMDNSDEQQQIDAYDQFIYIAKESCSMTLNRYLLFLSRPKNISRSYSVRIDVFEKNAITYVGSWHFPIAFLFLPVNRLSIALNLSDHQLQYSSNCSKHCIHGDCVKYINLATYFCRCSFNWSGIQCDIPVNCNTCVSQSMCIGSANNRSICVCPMNSYGRQCSFVSKCPLEACQNNGRCVPADVSIPGSNHTCICSDRFFGKNCEYRKAKLTVSLDDMHVPSYLVAYFFTLSNKSDPIETTVLRKMTFFQRSVTFHIAIPYQLAFIEANDRYFLAALQQSPKADISTSINPKQACTPAQQLLNSTVLELIFNRRIVHLHWLCYTNHNLTCFIDGTYLCLCTKDHHANCLTFKHSRNFTCSSNDYCLKGGKCLQDHPSCPSTKICLCPSCFFGARCQFYAKGLGSTLDEILGYEFQHNTNLSKQPITVKVAAALTIVIFLIGIVSSILSIITFSREKSQQVGCGIYLLASSITSLCSMILLILKFYFLFYSYQDNINLHDILKVNCYGIEPVLKVFLSLDQWLNACTAFERAMNAVQGARFNKSRSRQISAVIATLLFFGIVALFIPQIIHLHLFYDDTEERTWCVVKYKGWLAMYSTILIFVHYCVPLAINILSIICAIVITSYRRSLVQTDRSFWIHLKLKIRKNRHLFISSATIICLTAPYLIISITLDCRKSSHLFWFYLSGYFLSFFPAAFIFPIFVLPSALYNSAFHGFIFDMRKRISVLKRTSPKF